MSVDERMQKDSLILPNGSQTQMYREKEIDRANKERVVDKT